MSVVQTVPSWRRKLGAGALLATEAERAGEQPRHEPLESDRVSLTQLSCDLHRRATPDDIPDAERDRLARTGFDWVWLLSVWQTGPAGQRISRSNAQWRREFGETLPDLREEDIPGSGFAITGYTVHRDLGGDAALARLRERLRKRGLRLMLDIVPNHTGPDHPWVEDHPSTTSPAPSGTWAGRSPTTSGSSARAENDTLQLDYG